MAQTEEAFSEKLMDALNNAALGMGIAMGDYMGLFKAMAELEKSVTSAELAERAGLNERLVAFLAIFTTITYGRVKEKKAEVFVGVIKTDNC